MATQTPPIPVPPAPPVVPPPPPAPSLPKSKKPFPLAIVFAILGVAAIVIISVATGLLSRFVPGLGPVTITYWGLWEEDTIIRPILDEFESTHPGIKVNYQFQSHREYRERLQSALSQGKGPDVFRIHNTWTPMFRSDLSPVPASVFSVADYEKTFYPAARVDFKLSGQYVAIPLETDGIAMFINDDLLNKTGLAVPKDWDELRETALAMSICASATGSCESGGKIIVSGAALGSTQNIDHWEDILAVLMLQNNVNLANPYKPDPKPAQDVIDYFTNFVSLYRIWDANLPSSTNSFASGKVGIYFGPSWRVFDVQNLNPNLKFTVYPLPQLPTDPDRGEKPITYASYWAEAVNRKSAHSAQAWELLKYLSTPDIMRKLYTNAQSPLRSFGEPYSRIDMVKELLGAPHVTSYISQAPLAKSWYLASYTHDGKGLNTKLSDLYSRLLSRSIALSAIGAEINNVLSEYGLSSGSTP